MSDKAVLTCALTGVLTNPKSHPVPVTPKEMAASARDAFNAGASIMHVHLRQQGEGLSHLPSWDPEVAAEIEQAIRAACPGVIFNLTTGVVGPDISGPIACIRRLRPEIAACNAGTLNYLKLREDGQWAWPPMVFDNPVEKVKAMLDVMAETHTRPEFECFDVGIVRCVGLYLKNGMCKSAAVNFVMGVASGMPADVELLPLLIKYKPAGSPWQSTIIGRSEIWPVHQATAERGGMLRTGLEDTFYLPNGQRASGNGPLIEALAGCAKSAGRGVATPDEARRILNLSAASRQRSNPTQAN
jgi:3-keto-5-aminohexanoate cleavage enzyme